MKTVEAVIDEQGNVRLLEPVRPQGIRRALVTILEESPADATVDTAILSEDALAQDWNRPGAYRDLFCCHWNDSGAD